jgi:hypothetical protein
VSFTAAFHNVAVPAGTPVGFLVTGANPGQFLVDASTNGTATLTYAAFHPGTDTVTARAFPSGAELDSLPITFTWAIGKDTSDVSLAESQLGGPAGRPATVSAGLYDVSQLPATPVGGATLTVSLGTQSCTITTTSGGVGSCQVTPPSPGILPVSASFAGSTSYTPSSDTASFFATAPQSPPAFTSAASDTVPAGTAFTYPVTTTGTPTPAITLASGSTLPSGVTLTDNGNGTATLAGTSAVTPGVYIFSIQAANTVSPSASQPFKLTVTAPTLTSIAVTPANPSITKGATEQFTATGTYSNSSTANITSQVTWASGTTSVAAITSGGLASGVAAGSSTITATLGSVSGNTKLTVTAPTVEVSLKFIGSISYVNSGSLTSGGFTVSPATGAITSVTGTGTIPGLKGGSVTIKVAIQREPVFFFGAHPEIYVGYISVNDPGAHIDSNALVFTSTLTRVGSSGASGVAYGLALDGKTLIYQLNWTI